MEDEEFKKKLEYQGDASSRLDLKENDLVDKGVAKTPDIEAINHSMRDYSPGLLLGI